MNVWTVPKKTAFEPLKPVLFLALVFHTTFLGCGPSDESAEKGGAQGGVAQTAPLRGGSLRVILMEPTSLDPLYVDDVYAATITNQVYDGLIRLDETCNLKPNLSSSWIVSRDGLKYEFTLRPGLRFSDGSSLSSFDVVVSFASILSPLKLADALAEPYLESIRGAGAFQRGEAPWPTGLSAPDSLTVRIALDQPLSTFLSALTMDQARIVPWRERIGLIPGGLESADGHVSPEVLQAAARSPLPQGERVAPPGSGPFIPVEWQREDHITMVRNPHYWGETPGVDTLRFVTRQVWNGDDVVRLFLDQEADMTFVPRGRRAELEKAGARIVVSHELSVSFIAMRMDRPPFDNLRLRQAIAQAIDVESLAALDPEIAAPATGILPPGMRGYSPTPRRLPYDPDAARKTIATLGTPAFACTLFTTRSSDPNDRFDALIAENLEAVGINYVTEYLEWSDLDQRMSDGSLGMFSIGWVADLPDPDSFFHALFHSKGPNNLFGFADDEVDRLIEEARGERTADRWEIYRRLEEMILRQAPLVPLRYASDLIAWQPYVTGVRPSPLGTALMQFKNARLLPRDPRLRAQHEGTSP
jgi:ABC-type transport system substrate-binding protein